MLVFRLESSTASSECGKVQKGFYAYVISEVWEFTYDDEDIERNAHPLPYEDSMLSRAWFDIIQADKEAEYYFGFNSIEQFHRWFFNMPALTRLSGEFQLAVYDCELVHEGFTQVIFHSLSDITLVRTFSPDVSEAEVHEWLSHRS